MNANISNLPQKAEMLELALSYAGDGFPVFPCDPATKKPLSIHGFHDATTDEALIRQWWENNPNAMVGWPTKGFCVLDCDLPQGPDSLKALEAAQGGPLPKTMTTRTPSGGTHFIFQTSEEVKNTASGIGVDLDIRGEGGYIILAGSVNATGKAYETIVDLPPAPAPAKLVRMANSCKSGEAKRPKKNSQAEPIRTLSGDSSPYGMAALEKECHAVGTAPEGTRNQLLNDAAFSLGTLVAGGELQEGEVVAALTIASMQAGLSRTESDKTIRSGLEAGKLSPRQAPNQKTYYSADALRSAPMGGGQEHEDNKVSPYSRFSFRTAADLAREIRPTSWLVSGIIESNALISLFADPGSYKTFLAISFGLSIGTGTPWHGRPVKKGLVVFIIGEGSNGFAKRLKAWSLSTGISLDDAALIVSTAPAQLLDNSFAAHVQDCITAEKERFGDPVLVVIDTLARNFGNGDENSTGDMTRFVSNLDAYLPNCSRLIVHHTGHGDKSRGRGSSALKGAVDAEMLLEKTEVSVTLSCSKMKDAPPFRPISFEPVVIDIETTDPEKPETSLYLVEVVKTPSRSEAKLSPQMRIALNLLSIMSSPIRKKDLRGKCLNCLSDWMTLCTEEEVYSRSAFYTAIKTMEERGVIEISGSYVSLS